MSYSNIGYLEVILQPNATVTAYELSFGNLTVLRFGQWCQQVERSVCLLQVQAKCSTIKVLSCESKRIKIPEEGPQNTP